MAKSRNSTQLEVHNRVAAAEKGHQNVKDENSTIKLYREGCNQGIRSIESIYVDVYIVHAGLIFVDGVTE